MLLYNIVKIILIDLFFVGHITHIKKLYCGIEIIYQQARSISMKAMVYHGANDIRFEEKPVRRLSIRPMRW